MPSAQHPKQSLLKYGGTAIFVDDVPAAFARAIGAGAAPLAEPKAMAWGATVAYLRSPEGTLIGLSTPVGEPAS
jgi:uncharacterized glyoxalase superfamily protein PhnB